jgi:hypothetical protein
MSTSYSYHISTSRLPTEDERRLVEWLIANSSDSLKYANQIPQLRVVSRCPCGCPSVDFAIADRSRFGFSEVIARADGRTPEGTPVWVTLHSRQGEIAELEVYPLDRYAGILALPEVKSLKAHNRLTTLEAKRTKPSTLGRMNQFLAVVPSFHNL